MSYGGRGAGITATVASGTTAVAVLPNTGGTDNIIALAVSVFVGLVVWGATYSIVSR